MNFNDLIYGMKLNGILGELFIFSYGVVLDFEIVIVNKVLLKDMDLFFCLNDIVVVDMVVSDIVYWKIIL